MKKIYRILSILATAALLTFSANAIEITLTEVSSDSSSFTFDITWTSQANGFQAISSGTTSYNQSMSVIDSGLWHGMSTISVYPSWPEKYDSNPSLGQPFSIFFSDPTDRIFDNASLSAYRPDVVSSINNGYGVEVTYWDTPAIGILLRSSSSIYDYSVGTILFSDTPSNNTFSSVPDTGSSISYLAISLVGIVCLIRNGHKFKI